MGYFYYEGKLYYRLMDFARDYSLSYEGLRYALRSYGGKRQYMEFLDSNPHTVKYLIERYRIKES